jgi:hypothetical protein
MIERPTLPHIVECKFNDRFFEPIAAFNCIPAARAYKADCEETNPHFSYRINSHYGDDQ